MPLTLPNTFVDGPGNIASGAEVMDNFNAVNAGVAAATVTSLPASPVNGQDCYYLADATNGAVWHLKYRSASASAYKWEFVGGPDLFAFVDTSESVTSATFTNPTTAGPDITVPLAGDYLYVMEANVTNNTANIVQAQIGLLVGGVGATSGGPDTASWTAEVAASGHTAELHRSNRKQALTAGTVLRVQYLAASAMLFKNRRLRLRPVRVG